MVVTRGKLAQSACQDANQTTKVLRNLKTRMGTACQCSWQEIKGMFPVLLLKNNHMTENISFNPDMVFIVYVPLTLSLFKVFAYGKQRKVVDGMNHRSTLSPTNKICQNIVLRLPALI